MIKIMRSLPRLALALFLPLVASAAADATCDCADCGNPLASESERVIRILNLKTKEHFAFMGIEATAAQYYEETGVRVELDWINDKSLRAAELKAQLQSKLQLYDGFVLPSHLIGYAAQFDGFMDLTEVVRTRPELDWPDIFLGFRDNVAVYDNRVYLFPLDGDANYMFYRSDVLEHFNLTVPRTWEEYWRVAEAIHLKEYEGKTMYGSCLGRKAGEGAGAFWAMDVLSSYTQTKGKSGGFLFDPDDMTPLMGEAMAEAIKMLEKQVRFGHPNEFEGEAGGLPGSINVVAMNIGECGMTINWGDSFTQSYSSGSQIVGLMNVAPLPGADKVLNRESMTLEPCTKQNCGGLGGREYDDIGWVNTAQFLAGGGWAGAVNNNVDYVRKQRALDFFTHLCSTEASLRNLIQKAACPRANATGVDPFRASHFDIDQWVEAGYDREAVESYEEAVVATAANPNAAIDLRFAGGEEIYSALAEEVQTYLELVRTNSLPESEEEKQLLRMQTAERISERFTQIVKEEDAKPETAIPVLEQYQRDLGIFRQQVNHNQIGDLRIAGFVLLGLILACSVGFALWVFLNRGNKVVNYSQPFFLYLLCAGTFVMGCAILPLSIDDSFFGHATDDCPGCDKACVAFPWLFFSGFCIIFSTLFSKLWRVNRLIKASVQFRRIKCKPKDVMRPFAVIFGLNIILLTCWTAIDPLQWQRIWTDPLNSYGTCRPNGTGSDGDMTATTTILSFLAIVNIMALILASVQAFKARHITSEVLSESKYISLAIFANLQCFLLGLPLLFIVEESPSAKYFLQVGIVSVICLGMLLLIFCPKMYYLKYPPPRLDFRTSVSRTQASNQVSDTTVVSFNAGHGKICDTSVKHEDSMPELAEMAMPDPAQKETELAEMEKELRDYKLAVARLCADFNIDESKVGAIFSSVSLTAEDEVVEEESSPESGPQSDPNV